MDGHKQPASGELQEVGVRKAIALALWVLAISGLFFESGNWPASLVIAGLGGWIWPRQKQGGLPADSTPKAGGSWGELAKFVIGVLAVLFAIAWVINQFNEQQARADCAPIRDEVTRITSNAPTLDRAADAAGMVLGNRQCFNDDDIEQAELFRDELARILD